MSLLEKVDLILKKAPLILGVVFFGFLFGDEQETHESGLFTPGQAPWFTGPLLAPSAQTVRPGHLKFQPYLNCFVNVGHYNQHWKSHSRDNFYDLNLRLQTKFGLSNHLDFQLVPRFVYRETQGCHDLHLGDMPLDLNVQILRPESLDRGVFLKLALRANAPLGKYEHLNPAKKRTDVSGSGCWFPGVGLVLSHLWHIEDFHYVEFRGLAEYRFGVPVSVKGVNAYGGDKNTKGTVYPGNYLTLNTGIQYNFTRHWAFACDFRYSHNHKDRFSGRGSKNTKHPSSEVLSLAPAIEYNFSQNLGVIGGVWFSLIGRNTHQFVNGMFSVVSYF